MRQKSSAPYLSMVVPFYNEEEVALIAIREISAITNSFDFRTEIIAVNDGSTDATLEVLLNAKKNHENLRILNFKRNWGHMTALSHGLLHSQGEIIISIDGDLQDPPEYISELISIYLNSQRAKVPIDVVQTVRTDRSSDSYFKRTSATLYYKLIRKLTGVNVIPHAADYRLLNRTSVDLINSMNPSMKVFRILIPYLGLRIATLDIRRDVRFAGKSKYRLKEMVKLTFNSFFSFSSKPLRIISASAFFSSIFLFFLSLIFFFLWLRGATVPGWTSIVLLMTALNCFLIATLGVLGEFIGRIYELAQNRSAAEVTEEF